MKPDQTQDHHLTEKGVQEEIQRQPSLMTRLVENSLTVATSLRDNYFKNTARFVAHLRQAMDEANKGERPNSPLKVFSVGEVDWSQYQNEVVTFIDGGIGRVQFSSQVPILLRVGSYCVRTGERCLAKREQFGYYPVILGDLEGGSKERKDFPDIVRITAELLGGLSALERTPDLSVLMFHGPLVYLMGGYAGHTPFTEKDIDLFLHHYARDTATASRLKDEFLQEAFVNIYPQMTGNHKEWKRRRLFEPLAWMAFLYRRLIQEARKRKPVPIIAGVVERGDLREFSECILLDRVFLGLREKGNDDYFNKMYGRSDLDSSKSLLDKLGYTDTLLLAMLLRPGEYSEPWNISKYDGLRKGEISLPGEPGTSMVNFAPLKPGPIGFPKVLGCYVHVSETTEPIRVEIFEELGRDQIAEAARRVYLYSRLLPGYGFPVGLDIADKFVRVPNWLTDAYSKLIRHHLGVSLQQGEISDAEMRRILIQAIYMTHRDWLFRPSS
ncbi:DNA double-strand break repair nuclease NurA [Chloracidobacterium thermophilum]|uniref:NurA domain protein n=1 Tax=Chloracidobacterium thermophilum (strain B) TaxID=981222 RepID=G2LFP3_CHLTF|nr:DNA double-strand break repair nuclease NurA [Chloracidobacterium thermophilum]AEP11687.1 NurA domain protein [Chloracidobacterium thermophilum B]QUV79565.1 DNA double-strand break repair nuclease NurA [Chloracidobacterium thermophilum]